MEVKEPGNGVKEVRETGEDRTGTQSRRRGEGWRRRQGRVCRKREGGEGGTRGRAGSKRKVTIEGRRLLLGLKVLHVFLAVCIKVGSKRVCKPA